MLPTYNYYPNVLRAIGFISQGLDEARSCRNAGISVKILRDVIKSNTEIREMYQEARDLGHDAMRDVLLHIDDDEVHGRSDPRMARIISENIKWLLERSDPERYGSRVHVKNEVSVDITITSQLENARQRATLIASRASQTVEDAVIIDEDEEFMRDLAKCHL